MVPTTDARTTKRRQRKSLLYMQRSCPELKDCSLWLRNLIAARPARDLAHRRAARGRLGSAPAGPGEARLSTIRDRWARPAPPRAGIAARQQQGSHSQF